MPHVTSLLCFPLCELTASPDKGAQLEGHVCHICLTVKKYHLNFALLSKLITLFKRCSNHFKRNQTKCSAQVVQRACKCERPQEIHALKVKSTRLTGISSSLGSKGSQNN